MILCLIPIIAYVNIQENKIPLQNFRVGNSLTFSERKSKQVQQSKSLPSFFCHERRLQIAHSRSFVTSDGNDSLTFALL